jgi:outer membrane cobalamin receptor
MLRVGVIRLAPLFALLAFLGLTGAKPLFAAEVKGIITDLTGNPVSGATIATIDQAGVIVRQISDTSGGFDFNVSPLYENVQLRISAPGFQTVIVAESASRIQLAIAPDNATNMQGAAIGAIVSQEIRDRNEVQALDLLRYIPGMVFAQSGARGSPAALYVRGADADSSLVLLNGIPVNGFFGGGRVDFAPFPSDVIEEIDVTRGPQSAIYGSYATGSVVNLTTRTPDDGPALDMVAEGGSHDENRFALSGSDLAHGWGLAGSFSSLLANGPVRNSDYRNDNGFLSLEHRWYTQSLFAFGNFDFSDAGDPGPSGSPSTARDKNNTSTYGVHYQNDFTPGVRLDVSTGFFLNNSLYASPLALNSALNSSVDSNKDIRLYGDARGTFRVLAFWTLEAGFSFAREEMKNAEVAATGGYIFPLRRDNEGIYLDNQFAFLKNKLFLDAALREEVFQTGFIPADSGIRPAIPADGYSRLDPRISAGYIVQPTLRMHASYGTGIRPPGASELAFTNNPGLRPERTEGYDIGIEERFLAGKVSLDATWFRNRYRDLIVPLGGSLSTLTALQTENIGNALAKGAEFTARARPSTWLSATASYTWLESELLSLTGTAGLVPQYLYQGQPLLGRPKQSGSAVVTFHYGNFDVNLLTYIRGHVLDPNPNTGVAGGLYRDGGYVNAGINVNYRVRNNLTVYANLRNALDRHYEEVYGYPSPLLNFVTGLKWNLARAR